MVAISSLYLALSYISLSISRPFRHSEADRGSSFLLLVTGFLLMFLHIKQKQCKNGQIAFGTGNSTLNDPFKPMFLCVVFVSHVLFIVCMPKKFYLLQGYVWSM